MKDLIITGAFSNRFDNQRIDKILPISNLFIISILDILRVLTGYSIKSIYTNQKLNFILLLYAY